MKAKRFSHTRVCKLVLIFDFSQDTLRDQSVETICPSVGAQLGVADLDPFCISLFS